MLLTGYDSEGEIIWRHWGSPRLFNWKPRGNWFPGNSTIQTKQLLSNYLSITKDDKWDEVLHNAIHWFVDAQNSSTLDTGIVHAQIGLELLAWAKFVEIDQAMNKDAFKKLSAKDRMLLLLDWAGIPAAIPREFEELVESAKAKNKTKNSRWDLGSIVITELRNGIAHPNLRDRSSGIGRQAKIEVWHLVLWYLELLILRLLNYEGEYFNRWKHGWIGETEQLPWAP